MKTAVKGPKIIKSTAGRSRPTAGKPSAGPVRPITEDKPSPRSVREDKPSPRGVREDKPAADRPVGKGTSGVGPEPVREDKPSPRSVREDKPSAGQSRRLTAEEMASKQREISVSEFFTKNRHLLGFDNPSRALLTAVKEAVDNSLDACEEAGILPDVSIEVRGLAEDRFHLKVEDNGPGIVKAQIPRVFGKLLYGSKFHTLKMARGQQGIGISAVCLYSQLTTGKPMHIVSRTSDGKPAHAMDVMIDSNKNEPIVSNEHELPSWRRPHGTLVEVEIEGRYQKGDKSVDEYVAQTALANPHVKLTYQPPGEEPHVVHDRLSKSLPEEAKAIKPHPYGVELGTLMKILQSSRAKTLALCLKKEFSRVSDRIAAEICRNASLEPKKNPAELTPSEYDALHKGILKTKIMAPPTDCISPIGEEQILKALQARVKAEFTAAVTRPPTVYRGNPFQVEVGLAYGVEGLAMDETCKINRYANRVPLLYQPGACAITESAEEVDWRNYHLTQAKGSLPQGPMLLLAHVASVWVPFTSEAKEAIAHYPEIMKEVKLGFQEVGRQLSIFLSRKRRAEHEARRREIFQRYIDVVADSLHLLTRENKEMLRTRLLKTAKSFTKELQNEAEG